MGGEGEGDEGEGEMVEDEQEDVDAHNGLQDARSTKRSKGETEFEGSGWVHLSLIRTHVDGPHPDRFRRLRMFFYQLGQP